MDGTRVDISSHTEVTYWCKRLHCTEHQLREAVSQVGALQSNVQAYIAQRMHGLDHLELPRGRKPS